MEEKKAKKTPDKENIFFKKLKKDTYYGTKPEEVQKEKKFFEEIDKEDR